MHELADFVLAWHRLDQPDARWDSLRTVFKTVARPTSPLGWTPTQVGAGWPLATPSLSIDTPPRLIDKLIETTKRVCVNLDTLQRPNTIELIVDSQSAR